MKKLLLIFICGFIFISMNFRLPKNIFDYNYSRVVLDRNNKILRVTLNKNEQFILPPNLNKDKIPNKLKTAVIFFEDKNFYSHFGVDISAIIRALYKNLKYKTVKSGASTITMQLSRIFLPKKRTVYNKIKEIFHALQIEIKYSKDEILNIYLNHAPYGGNIRGYKTASYKYFNKEAKYLTWAEAVTLAILPNAPSSLTTVKNRKNFIIKRNKVLKKMYIEGVINKSDYNLSILEPLPEIIYSFPFEAPQFCEKVLKNSKANIIKTTLDLRLQKQMEELSKSYSKKLKREGINNLAALIVDTKTREVKAYIGSQNYFDNKYLGKIDGVSIKRSTGSTLKPFLYALSIDSGIITPDSILEDVPKNYGNFSPLNSSRKYSGIVTVREALQNSLNIPAVNLLNLYGIDKFYNYLKKSNIENLNEKPSYYGLSIILGSVETTLWDLTKLYCSLGNMGNMSELTFLKDRKKNTEKQLISKGASDLTLDILSGVRKPFEFNNLNLKFYWKTGTSFGQRDGLAVGVNSNYTIGVWTGNFDGKSSSGISGIKSSAPLLFRILNELEYSNSNNGEIKKVENSLKKVKVTENYYSTNLNNKELKEFKDYKLQTAFIPKNVKELRKDPYEKIIYTTPDGKYRLHSRTDNASKTKKIVKTIFSDEVIHYLKQNGIDYSFIPFRDQKYNDSKISFLYPKNGMKIKIPKGLNGTYEKVKFEIIDNSNSKKFFWFINKEFVKTTNVKKVFLSLNPGINTLTIINEFGTSKTIKIFAISNKKDD